MGSVREFKFVTSKPLMAILAGRNSSMWGSHFYLQQDGRKFWGNRFTVLLVGSGNVVHARDAAVVRVFDSTDNPIATSPVLAPGTRWQLPTSMLQTSYTIEASAPMGMSSTAVIAVEHYDGNGFTVVPPIPQSANGSSDDCSNDVGLQFAFTTVRGNRGSLAVFNNGNTTITFSLIRASNNSAVTGYQNISVAPRTAFVNTMASGFSDLGTNQYRLTASGPVMVWAGDLQSGTGLADFGDDVASHFGDRGLSFLIHSQTFGATVFAAEDNTVVTYTTGATTETATLHTDGFLNLPPGALYQINSTRPVSVQTAGSEVLDDFSMTLRPAQKLDTDNNGIRDVDEGGNCSSVAPDTDGDGVFNFEDTDDDNDCVPDVADSSRLVSTLPNALRDLNCPADAPSAIPLAASAKALCPPSMGALHQP